MATEEVDCTEGCSHADGFHKWEIEPNPYGRDFDVYVTDDDAAALLAAQIALENGWDDMDEGSELTITIRMNKPKPTPVDGEVKS